MRSFIGNAYPRGKVRPSKANANRVRECKTMAMSILARSSVVEVREVLFHHAWLLHRGTTPGENGRDA